jgi:hypothetical protein
MGIFWRIVIGLIIAFVGFWFVWKTMVAVSWFGYNDWAETKFGTGGTYFFYKMVGIIICFIGIFIAVGIMNDMLTAFANLFVQ